MAEYCPKCNYKLKITDWRPECPKCGVNVMYYGIEDRLRAEADVAERQHAKMQPKFDRLKFALIGHPLSIVRLVLGLLPIVATLLPMGKVNYILPFAEKSETVNLISIVTFIIDNGFDVDLLLKLFGSELLGKSMILWTVSLVCLVLMVVLALVGFILLTMSCGKKGISRNITFASIGIGLSTVSFVSYVMMINSLSSAIPDIFSGSVNPIAYICAVVVFIAMIVVNIVYKKKDIQVKYKDVSEFLLPYNERPSTIAKNSANKANA